ncbi:hypothetical protein N9917_00355 [Deltaproteobacteria bacterium]|nr:hypothetical protein [Deltaproteobacteria bacterium]
MLLTFPQDTHPIRPDILAWRLGFNGAVRPAWLLACPDLCHAFSEGRSEFLARIHLNGHA